VPKGNNRSNGGHRKRKPRAARYANLAEARGKIKAAQREWYAQTFGHQFPAHAIGLLGPSVNVEAAARDREANLLFDALKAAMLAADAWCSENPNSGGPPAYGLRQLFPPNDGGRSGQWPSLRGWVDRWRLSSGPLAPGTTSGLAYLVETLDRENVLGLPDGETHSRFLSDTELAKVALICAHWPTHGVPAVSDITEGTIVAILAKDVRDIRKNVGQLKTFEDKTRMGVAPKRGPRPG
jgi:hypothetical protein